MSKNKLNKQSPKRKISKSTQVPRWGYTGKASPEHWAKISPDYWQCGKGLFQSPISIESSSIQENPEKLLVFHYQPSPIDVIDNCHTVQLISEEKNTITINGHEYTLQQIHFHEPSEHHVDGIIYPMEMHLVHTDASGKLAVIAVFIKIGKRNEELALVWKALQEDSLKHIYLSTPHDFSRLLPKDKTLFHYTGSLTTPPCSEGVEWLVLKNPITLSRQQIEHYRKRYQSNNRPIQQQQRSEEGEHKH